MGTLLTVPLSAIRENTVALRTVNRESEAFRGLVDSIRTKGFLGAITVRSKPGEDGTLYELIDGLHRFTASKDAGLAEINVDVVSLDETAVLEAQIMTNVHRVETRPVEYSNQLRRLMSLNPLLSKAELATRLGKSPAWIEERLGLSKITDKNIAELVDSGKIPLSNAYLLAKLPADEQVSNLQNAMQLPAIELAPVIQNRLKEIKAAKLGGDAPKAAEWQPVAHLRKLSEIKDATSKEFAAGMVAKNGVTSAVDAFALAIAWVLSIDPEGIAAQKQKEDERVAKLEEAKKIREQERAKAKAEEAAKKAAAIG